MTNNIDRSHELLKETFFVVYHGDSGLIGAFIARPLMEDGKLTGWLDNSNRPRMAFADDQIIRLHERDGLRVSFFDAEDLFHV